MKPILGDSDEDGALLLGGFGQAQQVGGAFSMMGGGGATLARSSRSSASTARSSRGASPTGPRMGIGPMPGERIRMREL